MRTTVAITVLVHWTLGIIVFENCQNALRIYTWFTETSVLTCHHIVTMIFVDRALLERKVLICINTNGKEITRWYERWFILQKKRHHGPVAYRKRECTVHNWFPVTFSRNELQQQNNWSSFRFKTYVYGSLEYISESWNELLHACWKPGSIFTHGCPFPSWAGHCADAATLTLGPDPERLGIPPPFHTGWYW